MQNELRLAALGKRAALDVDARKLASTSICERLGSDDLFVQANTIACYVPMKSEVDTWPLIRRGFAKKKRVFVPVTQKNYQMVFRQITSDTGYATSNLGIREPVGGDEIPTNSLDLVVVPVVAFDDNGNRIGMGGGYYDRAFSFLKDACDADRRRMVGVAFDCQYAEKISANPWDISLFRIFTETRTWEPQ